MGQLQISSKEGKKRGEKNHHVASRKVMGQRAGKAGGQPGTPAGWQGVPLSSGLPPISLGCCPHFCKEILGPGFKLQEEAGRAAAGHCGYPSWGASMQTSLRGRDAGWDVFLPVVFLKAGQPSHLTPCFLPSICLHYRNLSISLLPPPRPRNAGF